MIWLWRASAAGLVIAFCRDRVRLLPGTAALAAALLALAWLPAAAVDLHTLEIVSRSGVHVFSVELAVTDAERARGLMFRRELPEGQGMLFDFGRDQDIAMWMKNTFIPLDMVFITGEAAYCGLRRIPSRCRPASSHRADRCVRCWK